MCGEAVREIAMLFGALESIFAGQISTSTISRTAVPLDGFFLDEIETLVFGMSSVPARDLMPESAMRVQYTVREGGKDIGSLTTVKSSI
jgi:hypothetical protein